jgi:Domain of unknown function (DUF4118)
LSAWYYGVGPSVVCTIISVLGVWYWFLPYSHSFVLQNPKTEISGMVLFSLLSILIITLGEANRRSKARSEQEASERSRIEDELRRAQAQLETRVQKRTAELNVANQKLSLEAATVKAQAEWLDAANDATLLAAPRKPLPTGTKAPNASTDGRGPRPWASLPTSCCIPFFPSRSQKSPGSVNKTVGRESSSIPGGMAPRSLSPAVGHR